MRQAKMRVFRGQDGSGELRDYTVEVDDGMVVLDVLHRIQARHAPDMAVRWNCKAGKCGSCSAEVNGRPRLTCMTRMDDYDPAETITVEPVKTFPHVKDLVTDVSWNFEVKKRIPPFKMREGQERVMYQRDVDRIQEFRKCIECFLCQNVCHVLRDHDKHGVFGGPRYFIYTAALEMHPWDDGDRIPLLREQLGLGYCNITKCCTQVCPEHINITDNGIIPMKERVVDRNYDPFRKLWRKLAGKPVKPPVGPPPRD